MLTKGLRPALFDLGIVLLFVIIGRQEHEGSSALGGIAETAAPFLIGLLVAWLAAFGLLRSVGQLAKVTSGLLIWPITVIVGMFVRRLVFDDGTAVAFVIVATLFLGAGLLGWRAVAGSINRN